MMINVFIYIEFWEEVKRLLIALMPWQRLMVTIHRKEVRGSEKGIEVDNWCDWFPVWIDIRLNNPHARDITWCFIFMRKPVDQCAGVHDPIVGKWEEKMCLCNFKTKYTRSRWIGADEECIILPRPSPPMINSMNTFTLHATNPGEVTWGMEGGNGTGMDGDFLVRLLSEWMPCWSQINSWIICGRSGSSTASW